MDTNFASARLTVDVAQVQKRGCERLAWDASFKEPKRFARYAGKPLYNALMTGTNELGEVRVQFHIVSVCRCL